MNASRLASRLLVRSGPVCARRQLSMSRAAQNSTSTTFQSYPLSPPSPTSSAEPPQPRGDQIPETSIAHPTPSRPSQSRSPDSGAPPSLSSSASKSASPGQQLSEEAAQKPKPVRARPRVPRARKAAMRLTPAAVAHLGALLDQPEPKLIRVGVRNRGCSGLAYHLEYVDRPAAFDEEVEQDGVRVLVDSKALFSIIGSEMDWVEDKLNQRFVFRNPNIKEQCGCGESFMV